MGPGSRSIVAGFSPFPRTRTTYWKSFITRCAYCTRYILQVCTTSTWLRTCTCAFRSETAPELRSRCRYVRGTRPQHLDGTCDQVPSGYCASPVPSRQRKGDRKAATVDASRHPRWREVLLQAPLGPRLKISWANEFDPGRERMH